MYIKRLSNAYNIFFSLTFQQQCSKLFVSKTFDVYYKSHQIALLPIKQIYLSQTRSVTIQFQITVRNIIACMTRKNASKDAWRLVQWRQCVVYAITFPAASSFIQNVLHKDTEKRRRLSLESNREPSFRVIFQTRLFHYTPTGPYEFDVTNDRIVRSARPALDVTRR